MDPLEDATPAGHAAKFRWLRMIGFAVPAAAAAGLAWQAQAEAIDFPKDVAYFLAFLTILALGLLAALLVPRTWSGRLFALGLVAAPFLALVALAKRVEFDGGGRPSGIVFRWENDPAERTSPAVTAKAPAPSLTVVAEDAYPQYRGPRRDGKSPGPALAADWSRTPPKRLWRKPCGGGYGAFAAVGEALFSLEQSGPNEALVCYRRDTGAEAWRLEYPARFEELMGGPGPRTTPTFDAGKVYSFGALGDLVCADAATGAMVWAKNPLKDFGAANLQWAMSGSPLVMEVGGRKLVAVNHGVAKSPKAGGPGGVAAFDANTGELAWVSKTAAAAGYASPVLATLAGAPTLLVFDSQGLCGLDPATGAERFRHDYKTNQGINVAQPEPLGDDRVLIAAGYVMGSAALKVTRAGDQWSVAQEWRQRRSLQCKFTTPIVHAGHAYGVNDTRLQCLDAATGASRWKGAEVGYGGQIVARGDLLIAQAEDGVVRLVKLDPAAYQELGVLDDFRKKRVWNTPTLAGRTLYLRNHEEMAAYELPLAP